MSKAMDISNVMVERLNAQLTLPDVSAIAWRQKDIASDLQRKTSAAGGALIVVLYDGFTNPAANASGAVFITRRYVVSIFSKPVLRDATETSADDIVEIVAAKLHDWEPDECRYGIAQISVTGCELRPDAKFLIYDLDVEVLSHL